MAIHIFQPVSPKVDFPKLEEEIIKYWKENQIFEKSIQLRPADKKWNFLDGPPFITGLPHYGTLLASIPKDLFPRYWTMKGYRVRRVWGWDVHGLPAENKVETQLGLQRKRDIEQKIGVKKFIELCRKYVSESSKEWEWYVDHIGRWVDFKNAYKTMDLTYMETVMWVFKQMYEKGFIYKGLRVSLYCPHCATPISNFEVAMDADNYKEITEKTAVFMYQLKDESSTYLLAWSTTPWNKIATPALAVNPKLKYIKVEQEGNFYILAKSTLKILQDKPKYKIVEEIPGKKLVGKEFVPHYNFYKIEPGKVAFKVIPGEFVTAKEGTGIVTIAAYGEEDLAVMQKENIQLVLHVDEEGMMKKEVPKWAGMYYLDTDPLVIKDLQERGLIYRIDDYSHTVPTCWRCHTRLYYAPQDAWYVNVQDLKSQLKATNERVHWVPAHFKYGRYLKSLESAPDWCISRSRYWGSPVPVWECQCGQRFVPGSIAELEQASGVKITDLHKPEIDAVTVTCEKCGQISHRVPEVLDSWIEAGSASFAERHWPFTKDIKLEDFFPPDFIVEYTGQIRAWFYVLHVIATALYGSHAYKNVVVTGVILGTDGRKMSKNYGNYPDPRQMLQKYGGDALRMYLLSSPVMHGEDIRISEAEYSLQVRGTLLILWNVYNFFVTYALIDQWSPNIAKFQSQNVLDHWILSLINNLIIDVTKALDAYDTVAAINKIKYFIDDLSTWYLRRSRKRVGPTAQNQADKNAFYGTLYQVLTILVKLLAPIAPFISESIYRNLTGEASVHLTDWPRAQTEQIHKQLEKNMQLTRMVVEKTLAQRKAAGIKVRQPLHKLTINYIGWQGTKNLLELIKDEVNVKHIELSKSGKELQVALDTHLTDELKAEGEARELLRQIQNLRKIAGLKVNEPVKLELPEAYQNLPTHLLADVKRKTLVKSAVWGKTLKILTG